MPSPGTTLWWWRLAPGPSLPQGHKGAVSCLAVAPDGGWFVTGGFDKVSPTTPTPTQPPTPPRGSGAV